MIKVPGDAGRASRRSAQLIGEGINVNVTLLFSQEAYEQVAEAYIAGPRAISPRSGGDLEPGRERGQLLRQPHRHGGRRARRRAAASRRPTPREQALLRSARRARWRSPTPSWPTSATRSSSRRRAGRRWRGSGAQTQRLLWASTGTKNPRLPRRALRRGADRPRHRQHDAAGDARRLPRSRPAARQPRARTSTAARDTMDDAGRGRASR